MNHRRSEAGFFCPGDRPLWVEVKTFDPTAEQREIGRAREDLQSRCAKEQCLTGDLHVVLGGEYNRAAGRWLLKQLRGGPRAGGCIHTFVIPIDVDDYSRTICLEYESTGGRVVQSTVRLTSGKYPWYPGLEPLVWHSRATVFKSEGRVEEPELYDLFDSDASLLSASWYPSDRPLRVGSISMGFSGNNTSERIVFAVKAANKQIRNGQKYRAAPGVCVIYHDSLDHAANISVATALFGQMLIPVGGTLDDAVIGRGGAWNAGGKNNGVGAVRYSRTAESFLTVINPWADQPVDPVIFTDRPWSLRDRKLIRL